MMTAQQNISSGREGSHVLGINCNTGGSLLATDGACTPGRRINRGRMRPS
jgi:hypothetical protein